MKVTAERRRKYFIDSQVQGAVLRQAMCYWLVGSVTFTVVVFVFRILPHCLSGEGLESSRIWHHLAPMIVSSAVFLPVVMFSAVRFSNRVVGPMVRFRRALRQLARGETALVLKLRRDDFWSDVADEINRVSARLCESSTESGPSCNLREMLMEGPSQSSSLTGPSSELESSGNPQETNELAEEVGCA